MMMENKTLPQIVDLGNDDIDRLLEDVNFGHLGLCRNNLPYVVPIHFAYDDPNIYFYTTEGLKTEIIDENPNICLQVEDICDPLNWRSVIVTGRAKRLTADGEINTAMKLIKRVNPKLVPAWSIRWMDDWIRTNIDVVYQITPEFKVGRSTLSE